MKIHLIVPVFPPESVASAVMVDHLAQGLVNQKHDVTVITSFPSKMQGVLFPGYRKTVYQIEKSIYGFRLCRVFTFFSTKSTIFSRLPEYLSYAFASNLASIFLSKPDVVFINTWPIATFITAVFCKLRGIPYVFNVQDLYPESAGGLGYLKTGGGIYKFFLWADRFLMKNAAHIIPISEEFANRIQKTRNVPAEKMTVIWNWYDGRVQPQPKAGEWRQKFAYFDSSFIIMYAGNIGSVAGLETVLEAAKLLAPCGKYVFVLAGDGTMREELEERCKKEKIQNVHFMYPLHRENLSDVQASADIMLITAKRGLAHSEVPSKMMGYMLSGRPILAMVDSNSNTARLVKQAICGLIGEPENPQILAEKILEMCTSGKFDEWGNNARQFALQHFDQHKNVARIIEILEKVNRGS